MLLSVATLGGVGTFFYQEFSRIEERSTVQARLRGLAQEEGPCTAMLEATRRMREPETDFQMRRSLDAVRRGLASEVLGGDKSPYGGGGQQALVSAVDEGLVSLTLCEQMGIASSLGEYHPVLALLVFTREGDACDGDLPFDQVIAGLGSHRAILLQGLMRDVSRLRCLNPMMKREVAMQVTQLVREDPTAFDDLDVWRIASFLSEWAPLRAAQLGCAFESSSEVSRLGNALGCSEDQKQRVLARYRHRGQLGELDDPRPQVVLLWQDDNRCDVRPVDSTQLFTVACSALEMTSSLEVAVRIEEVNYGAVRADLIAGLLRFEGSTRTTQQSLREPPLKSWFAYDRLGQPLGITAVTDLTETAQAAGVTLPENPLRAFCQAAGARYCYDVDWSQMVQRVEGAAVVYLSRPLDVFLPSVVLDEQTRARTFEAAFGRAMAPDTIARFMSLGDGRMLVMDIHPGGVHLAWQRESEGPWVMQGFGTVEGGEVPPTARMLAAMDLEADGRPELIVQRAERIKRGEVIRDSSDEILLMRLDAQGQRFAPLSRLTVHEY